MEFDYNQDFIDFSLPWAGHRYFAKALVEETRPSLIVELGTWRGTSMFAMLQGIKNKQLKTQFHAVDTWEGDKHAGYYEGDKFLEAINKIIQKHYSSCKIQLNRMRFEDAVDNFEDNSIDLLHIDGLHTYDAVKNDYTTWLPKLKADGIIMFHDINEMRDDFGVWELWAELKNDPTNSTIEFLHSHGLGVITKSQEKYEKLTFLEREFNNSWVDKLRAELLHENQSLKSEIKELNYQLTSIYNSKYWKIKEKVKGMIGKS